LEAAAREQAMTFDYDLLETLRPYLNISALARAHGISPSLASHRAGRDLTLREVFGSEMNIDSRAYARGVDPSAVRKLIRHGWKLEPAIAEVIKQTQRRGAVDNFSESAGDRRPVANANLDRNSEFHSKKSKAA
jgi:hypothetical protein